MFPRLCVSVSLWKLFANAKEICLGILINPYCKLYSWNILLPHQLYSFFKEPFDSKMIKIHYCGRNISRENRRIKRSELLHKIRYLEINDGVK